MKNDIWIALVSIAIGGTWVVAGLATGKAFNFLRLRRPGQHLIFDAFVSRQEFPGAFWVNLTVPISLIMISAWFIFCYLTQT